MLAVRSSTRQPDCSSNGVTQSVLGFTLPFCTAPPGTTTRMKFGLEVDVGPVGEGEAEASGGPVRVPEQAASSTITPATISSRMGRGARLARCDRAFSACPLLTER